MKHIFLYAAILLGSCTNSLLGQVYTANWEQSDFSNFGPQGGIIEVLYQIDSTGSLGLPDDFYLSFEVEPFADQNADQNFTFNATVFAPANELIIGVNEAYSAVVVDTSQLTIESTPTFAGWNLDQRVLDQAGMAVLGVYEDPPNDPIFFETLFEANDITTNPPPSGVFKTFELAYRNVVPTIVPADQVPKARYTLFLDAITYSSVPEPGTAGMLGLFGLALVGTRRERRPRN